VGPTAGLDAVAKRKIPPLLLPVIQLRSLYMHNFVCKNFFVSYELKLWRRCKTLRLCLITCTQLGLYTTRNCTELLTYLLTYLLTHSLHGSGYYLKADCHPASQKISCFIYGTRRFITVFTKAHHWILSRAIRIQFVPSIPISLRSV